MRRRRECGKCEHRFTTFERQEMSSIIVIKRDGTREPYSREKIERGVWLACTKRAVTKESVSQMLSGLEEKWAGGGKGEVPTSNIGEDLMNALKQLDHVAYIRYASIHREFKDVDEFKKELGKLFR